MFGSVLFLCTFFIGIRYRGREGQGKAKGQKHKRKDVWQLTLEGELLFIEVVRI